MLFQQQEKCLVDSCITCQLTNSFDDNNKFFQELRNMAVLKVQISKYKLLPKICYESYLDEKRFWLLLLYCHKYFWVNDTSFLGLPKLILGGVCALNNHIERCIYVAKSCVFLSETKNKNLHFFDFVQVLHIHCYMCKAYIFFTHKNTRTD